ncbi:AraC family transcriptional regulator [Pseudoflavitalea sp. X16]|uniref:helix-turn-helix domain-containing protein n=1 Tax=Paraflavitalea devenefica TaxID=2716334 RepID=UPI0014214F0D|nr:helix-turn-helix domain-containing protein [Paraflavitalea devenefica]NII23583.1 AraC family transcriptional regulator [Paraflavitalea devenefica]
MPFKVYIPRGILKDFVGSIVFMDTHGTGVAFQRAWQVIIINVGSNFSTSDVYTSSPRKQELTDTVWINGKQDNTFMLENTGVMAMYAIGLKPGMLPYLANLPAMETNDLAVSAEHWTSREIFNLREQLLACRDVHQGFLLIEKYLTALLLKRDLPNLPKVKWLDTAIHTSSVNEICRALGVTRKKLRSDTQHYFGDSVKNIQGILRFNNTLSAIAHNSHQSLSAVHDYYDQAHFINDFIARAGITPLQYKKLCLQYPDIKYTPNFIPVARETFLQFISG